MIGSATERLVELEAGALPAPAMVRRTLPARCGATAIASATWRRGLDTVELRIIPRLRRSSYFWGFLELRRWQADGNPPPKAAV